MLLDLYSLILLLEEFVSICKIILAFENRLLNMKILSKNPEEISLSIDVHIKTNALNKKKKMMPQKNHNSTHI